MNNKIDWEDNGLLQGYKDTGQRSVSDNPWENPQICGENKLPPASYRRHAQEYRQTLNGDWSFKWSPNPAAAPGGFETPDYDISSWKTIPVPSHMELQGYGIPIYTNIQYPFPPTQPTVPHDDNPVGCYRRDFEIPDSWDGRRIFVSFQGVDSFFYLWINGQYVGLSKVSRSPAEFELTSFLKKGVNTIAVKVYRWSDATYIEDQDMWWLSGIFREVYLFSTPQCRIRDFEIKNKLDKVYRDAVLEVLVELDGQYSGNSLRYTLADGENIIFTQLHPAEEIFRHLVDNPRKWSAEIPALYSLKIELLNSNGEIQETLQTNIGFRSVEIRNGEFLINGTPVLLRGVNRHEFNCRRGRAITEDDMLADIMLMKHNNINAVRTSHYPAQSHWYELCDKYGLYVLDEADCETHGYRNELANDPNWETAFLDRTVRMLERDKNHPSVVIWSLGNESGFGPNIVKCADWVHRRDPSRPVNYYHAGTDPCVDIVDLHYPSLETVLETVREEPSGRPILLEEYAHSMGNSTGNMREYWDMIESTPRLIGGFIWDWIDQGLERRTESGEIWYAYGGDFGDKPNDYQFCLNGIVAPERRAKPSLLDLKHTFRPFVFTRKADGAFMVKNRLSFRDLKDFKVSWELLTNGKITASGVLDKIACPPGATTEFEIKHPKASGNAFLNINVADSDYITSEDQFELSRERYFRQSALSANWQIRFDFQQGTLKNWAYEGHELLLKGPELQVWRAPTNNDRPFIESWRKAGLDKLNGKMVSLEDIEDITRITRDYGLFKVIFDYQFEAGGTISLRYTVEPQASALPCLPRLGIRLILPVEFENFEWFGRGPFETYRDRKLGARIGWYSGKVAEQYEAYVVPQDNGNKTDVHWAAVTNATGIGFQVISEQPLDTSIHYYTAEEFTDALHTHELGEKNKIVWNLDYANAGIGNGSHGPGTLEQYQVKPEKFSSHLLLIPYRKGEKQNAR